VLYCYNDLHPISVWSTMRELSKSTREYIVNKPALSRIEEL